MNDETPKFTPEQELANKWVADNWHTGLKISGTDTIFSAFYAFLAGYETAQSSSAARIEKLEGALRDLLGAHHKVYKNERWACTEQAVHRVLTALPEFALNPEETKGGGQ